MQEILSIGKYVYVYVYMPYTQISSTTSKAHSDLYKVELSGTSCHGIKTVPGSSGEEGQSHIQDALGSQDIS